MKGGTEHVRRTKPVARSGFMTLKPITSFKIFDIHSTCNDSWQTLKRIVESDELGCHEARVQAAGKI